MVLQTSSRLDEFEHRIPAPALLKSKKRTLELQIEKLREIGGQVAVKFVGIDTIGDALAIVGCEVFVEKTGPAAQGVQNLADLVGFGIFDLQGEEWGMVSGVRDSERNPLLEVTPPGGGEVILVPFREPIVQNVEMDQKIVRIDPPPGLRELNR